MKITLLYLPLVLSLGCTRGQDAHAADNTSRNVRDRNGQTVTATDQSESASDRALTQTIRRSLVDDDSLSSNAKNIKVVSQNGKVTLRGVVASQEEKDKISAKVHAISDVQDCDNQLDLKSN